MTSQLSPEQNESARLDDLRSFEVLDTPPEAAFDRLVQMAAEVCDAPIAAVSLIDDQRQWFKAKVGVDATQTPRDIAFCSHAIKNPSEPFVVPDAANDDRFRDNPFVTGGPGLRFYAGVPLVVESGRAMGALCVIDRVPRELTLRQLASLRALGRVVVRFLERRRQARLN